MVRELVIEVFFAAILVAFLWVIIFCSSVIAQAQEKEDLDCFNKCGGVIYCLDGQNYTRQDQIDRYGQAVGDLCDYAMSTEQELLICEDNLELQYGPKLKRVRKRFKRKLRALKARCGK